VTAPSDDVAATPDDAPAEDTSTAELIGEAAEEYFPPAADEEKAVATRAEAGAVDPEIEAVEEGPDAAELVAEELVAEEPDADELARSSAWAADAARVFRQMRFVGVEMDLPSPHPLLVLREIDAPRRRLEIPIGAAEGIAIAYAARGVPTPRPLTHQLFTEVLRAFDVEMAAVRITDVSGKAFRAEIVFSSPGGSRTISCRPSDAVALALRQPLEVPITVAAEVLEVAGS
jgi:hypothetical protein